MTNKIEKIELGSSKKIMEIISSTKKSESLQRSYQKMTPKKHFDYNENSIRFSGPNDAKLFLRKGDSLNTSENELAKISDHDNSDSQSKFSNGLTDVEQTMNLINQTANISMQRRRKSQGIDKQVQRSAQKYQYKPGKMVADYLPQILRVEKSSDNSLFQPASNNSSIMGSESNGWVGSESDKQQSRIVFDKKENQPQTLPLYLNFETNPTTPTKKKLDESSEQLLDDDSESDVEEPKDESDESDENQDDESENEAEKEAKVQEMKEFAEANGITLQFEKKQVEARMDAEEEKFVMTQEMLSKMLIEDDKRFMENMKKYIPPPLELLKKQYTNNEPVRTGFNQGLLPIQIKNNIEQGRTPQGPQIIVTTSANIKRENQVTERQTSRNSLRSKQESRDGSRQNSSHKETRADKNEIVQTPLTEAQLAEEADKQEVQQVIKEAFSNSETSLRHLFYLEYKKNFIDGSTNPIVYSRYGKKFYDSGEKFDNNNFNQLIRTCNLKKILRLTNPIASKGERKFSEPISFPSCDYYRPRDQLDRTLVFESRFESGNLQLVHKQSDSEYDLVLQNDINSKGHTQWFYFRVTNVKKGMKVKFNMLNMIKSKSLYNEGMKVLCYSEQKQLTASEEEKGWTRGGEEMSYYQNNYKREHQTNFQRTYYTFTFTHTFEQDDDTVYFSYSQPYTYSDLTEYLCEIQSKQLNYVSRNTLCRTIAGNKCEYLTITNRVPFEVDQKKQGVVISARIHPGESNASWMMKGVIDFLISDQPSAQELRDKFVFKIIPMLNPDGVINGNYRCSLAGCDLNRRWKYPSELLHPTVWHTKKLIMKLSQERPLALYTDIHGHSRRKNIFMYGNGCNLNPNTSRVFPFLMSKISQPHFSYDYSRFSVNRSKEQTSRIAVWRDLGSKHANIYTMEASFCGPKPVKFEPHRGKQKPQTAQELNYHFNTQDYLEVGTNLLKTLIMYRHESDTPMGLQNLEYQVEQYHMEKESKIEQEDLIRQQKTITEQRKLAQQNNRTRFNSNSFGDFDVKQSQQNAKEDPEQKEPASEKKRVVTKAKTSALTEDITKGNDKTTKKEGNKSQKCKYTVIEDSDDENKLESDSDPSDDNLDSDEISKLIPKKFQKNKYLRGVQETKKKPVVQEPEKKKVKKPKTTLMPCMIQAKANRDASKASTRNASESATKKPVQKLITTILKKGGQIRDVGTQIKYVSDGTNLSLMELDIMKHTGCRWSKVIFPGFKGTRFQESYMSAEKFHLNSLTSNYRTTSQHNITQFVSQSPNQSQSFMASFKTEFNQILDGSGLRNSRQQSDSSNSAFNLKGQSAQKMANYSENPPFQNEFILKAAREAQNMQNPPSIMSSLQKKINDSNFSEPRSLFGGSASKANQEPLRCNNSSSKKGKILGLPYDGIHVELSKKFDLGDLETVHEKAYEKTSVTLEVIANPADKSKVNIKRNSSINVKKVINGIISTQSSGIKIKNESGLKLRNPIQQAAGSAQKHRGGHSTATSASKNIHKHSASKSSFTNAAHLMLNASIDGPFNHDFIRLRNDREMATLDPLSTTAVTEYCQLANVAPSQMAQQVMKIAHQKEQRVSQLSNQKTKGQKQNLRENSIVKNDNYL